MKEKPKAKKFSFDECYCGDRRSDHIKGEGACRLNTFGHTHSTDPGDKCLKFRLVGVNNPLKKLNSKEAVG